INFVYDGGPFLAFFEILANITPITENEITYYSRILGIMLNEAVNITRGADTSNLRKLQNDIIDKLLTYPLSVSDSEFRNLRSYCSFEKTAILSKNGFRYTVNQIEELFNKAILDRKWDIIQTYFLDPFPINEDNRNFYNTFFMRLLAEENYDLSLIFLRKNSAQLNYKCSFPSDGDVALHYY
ncbi:MAG: hypothetical protein NTU49_04500, partial [Gammaproteobacteria bacterium]|nr:hypothetical protein [Gammaproteobacteria bacterium]